MDKVNYWSRELDFLHANYSAHRGGVCYSPAYHWTTTDLLDAMLAAGL